MEITMTKPKDSRKYLIPCCNINKKGFVWDENKKLCKLIIEKYSNIDIVNDLEKSYNYSSFLREKEATELLEKIINSNMNEAEVLLKTLFKKF